MRRRAQSASTGGESSRLSMPSASKIARTPLNRKSGIPMSSVKASSSKRTSYLGASEHHMKDPRPIHDKPYMRKCIMEIVKYLNENGYPTTITVKMMNPPSNREYYRIVEFIYQQLNPKYVIRQKPDEEVAKLFKVLCYPFTTSKSVWSNIGIMSSWPHALGALDWLLDMVKYSEAVVENELENFQYDGDETKKLKYEYYKRTYVEFMQGKDPPYEQINDEMKERIGELNAEKLKGVESLQKMNDGLQADLENLLREKEEAENIKEDHAEKSQTKRSFEKYFVDVDQYCTELQVKVNTHEDSIEQCSANASELRTEIAQLKSTLSQQDLSTKDIEIMNIENNQIISTIESLQGRNKKLESDIWEAEIEMAKIVDKINVQVVEFNEISHSLNLLSFCESANPDDVILAHGHAGISDNTLKLKKVIQPAMRELASKSLDEIGKLQQERNNLVSKKDQLCEQLEDYKEKKEGMKQELQKLNSEYATLQNEISNQEQSLKHDTEHVREALERVKMVNELSVEDMEQMLNEENTKLINTKASCKEQQAEMIEHVKFMFNKAMEQRKRCDESLARFKQHMMENVQKLKDVETRREKLLAEEASGNPTNNPTQQDVRSKDIEKINSDPLANITNQH